MSSSLSLLDVLLRLGEQTEAAVEAENWTRLAALVQQRTDAANRLPPPEERAPASSEQKRKLEALAAQHRRLERLLAERRDEVEDELVDLERLRSARSTYETPSVRRGLLHPHLSG